MNDATVFLLVLLANFTLSSCNANATSQVCADDPKWKDPTYGMGCDFYAKNDPGCEKYIDLGQISDKRCNLTCRNCDGSRNEEVKDPLDTDCSMKDLCDCFAGCGTASVCPASNEAQACQTRSIPAHTSVPPSSEKPYLELALNYTEDVIGVEVRGSATNYAKAITATWSG